ncbi:Uncharacterized protein OBRU01_06501, partial [Operophtera brumata]
MPENVLKMPRSVSPVARTGAGDISERELSRERHTLQTTPPAFSPVARTGAGDISERELSRECHTLQTTPPAAHSEPSLASLRRRGPAQEISLSGNCPGSAIPCRPLCQQPSLASLRRRGPAQGISLSGNCPGSAIPCRLLRLRECLLSATSAHSEPSLASLRWRGPARGTSPSGNCPGNGIPCRLLRQRECPLSATSAHSEPSLASLRRLQPVHPKKQLFFTPVSKFTASSRADTPHLARIRSCLEELTASNTATLARRQKMPAKSNSMEDLTPTKRMRKEIPRSDNLPIIRSPSSLGKGSDVAAARVARFMVVCAWRKRRDEVRCLRKTLEFQVSCSERLRLQVVALKSLLDSDNAKVRMAMRELERLKQLVRDKDKEKAVLERLSAAEEELSQLEEQLAVAEDEADILRSDLTDSQQAHDDVCGRLDKEQNGRLACGLEIAALNLRVSRADDDVTALKAAAAELRIQLEQSDLQLKLTREQLDWWPKPLT